MEEEIRGAERESGAAAGEEVGVPRMDPAAPAAPRDCRNLRRENPACIGHSPFCVKAAGAGAVRHRFEDNRGQASCA